MIGFVNVFKPEGESSSKTVQFVKHVLINKLGCDKKIKVGHFGTLDPDASGVLPIAVGNACRLFDFSLDKVKIYRAEIVFGIETTTLDTHGEIIGKAECDVLESDFISVLENFPKTYDQIPPNISAKSVGGVRAYKLARQGKEFSLPPKEVNIFNLKYIGKKATNVFEFEVECSAGTYIRSLCRDIGLHMNLPAVMGALLRLKSGEFEISQSVQKENFELNPTAYILPVDIVLHKIPEFNVEKNDLIKMKNGLSLCVDIDCGIYKIHDEGVAVGLAKVEEGIIKFITRLS